VKKLFAVLIITLFFNSVCFSGSWAPYFPHSGDYKIGTWEQEKDHLFDTDIPVHLASYSLLYLEWYSGTGNLWKSAGYTVGTGAFHEFAFHALCDWRDFGIAGGEFGSVKDFTVDLIAVGGTMYLTQPIGQPVLNRVKKIDSAIVNKIVPPPKPNPAKNNIKRMDSFFSKEPLDDHPALRMTMRFIVWEGMWLTGSACYNSIKFGDPFPHGLQPRQMNTFNEAWGEITEHPWSFLMSTSNEGQFYAFIPLASMALYRQYHLGIFERDLITLLHVGRKFAYDRWLYAGDTPFLGSYQGADYRNPMLAVGMLGIADIYEYLRWGYYGDKHNRALNNVSLFRITPYGPAIGGQNWQLAVAGSTLKAMIIF